MIHLFTDRIIGPIAIKTEKITTPFCFDTEYFLIVNSRLPKNYFFRQI